MFVARIEKREANKKKLLITLEEIGTGTVKDEMIRLAVSMHRVLLE